MNLLSQVEPLQPVAGKSRPHSSVGHWSESLLIRSWTTLRWIGQRIKAQQAHKNLRVCESVSLGEKRFVAVVQVDEERFLIGGSSSSVALLTRLQETKTFAAAVAREAGKIS
jgi:flagellar biogenesis protein FliO